MNVKDAHHLAEKIDIILNNKILAIKMGQAGYEKANREFNERKGRNIVLNTYKNLVEKNK